MQIRHADPVTDAAACAEIYAPFVTDSAVSFEEAPPTVDEFAAKIARLTATHAFFVAEDQGGVIGYAYASPYRERPAYRWSAEVSVYVRTGQRHRGVGRALYAELLAWLRQHGFRIVVAGVTQPNDASMALHTGMGFTPVGVFRKIGYKAGAWRDVAFLSLDLVPGDDSPPSGLSV